MNYVESSSILKCIVNIQTSVKLCRFGGSEIEVDKHAMIY